MSETLEVQFFSDEPPLQLPLLGTISKCEPTDYGWRGTMPNGGVVEVRGRFSKPNIPAKGRIFATTENGAITGVYLIKQGRKRPSASSPRASAPR